MREKRRQPADEGKQATCSCREARVGFSNSAGFTFQREWIAARRGQTKRGVGFSGVWTCDSGRGEGTAAGLTDLSPAAAGQRGKLYRHLSAQ